MRMRESQRRPAERPTTILATTASSKLGARANAMPASTIPAEPITMLVLGLPWSARMPDGIWRQPYTGK